tara:strand:- start:86 stop:1408 length:1323 start_codon:yes stop_codon:yes gene_type:complete
MLFFNSLFKNKNIYLLIIFVAVLISKIFLVSTFASSIPFWDQWGCILYNLLKPYEEGRLTINWLFTTHGEHFIFFTKLSTLSIYYLFNGWHPLKEIYFNTILHSSSILVFLSLIFKYPTQKKLFASFSLIFFIVSFSWENLLWGFQSHFHFVAIFGFLGMFFTTTNSKITLGWVSGLMFLVLSFFSSGGGIVFALAVIITNVCVLVLNFSKKKEFLWPIAILISLFIVEYALTPNFEPHHNLRAKTLEDFFKSYDLWSSWPININFSGFIVYLPSFYFLIKLKKLKIVKGRDNYMLALIIWSIIQISAISFARAGVPNPIDQGSRYLDHLAFSICINFVIILIYFPTKIRTTSSVIWSFVILFASFNNLEDLRKNLSVKKEQSIVQKKNMISYLTTNDSTFIYNKGVFDVPLFKVNKLRMISTDSTANKIIKKALKVNCR